jgi:hypothetical protein
VLFYTNFEQQQLHFHYFLTKEQWMDVIEDVSLDKLLHYKHCLEMVHQLDN